MTALLRMASPVSADPTVYPAELERGLRLVDGSRCQLRPIRQEDAEPLVAFHRRLFQRSTYFQVFHCRQPGLTAGEVERFTHVDYWDHLTLVAEQQGNLLGLGRFDRIDATTAEVALVAEGPAHGIATCLLDGLISAALVRGIATFTAEVPVANTDMLDVFWDTALPVVLSYDLGVVSVRFSIQPTLAYLEGLRHREATRRGDGQDV